MPLRLSRLAVLLACTAIPASALAGEFTTARGKTVAMPDIAALTCGEIERTLAEIDSTRYRENAPVNPDPADDPLFAYEQDLAHALFRVCVVEPRPAPKDAVPGDRQASNQ